MNNLTELLDAVGEDGPPPPGGADFSTDLYRQLISGSKLSNALGSAAEGSSSDVQGQRILSMVQRFMTQVEPSGSMSINGDGAHRPDEFEPVSDLVDLLLENVDNYLDVKEYSAPRNPKPRHTRYAPHTPNPHGACKG